MDEKKDLPKDLEKLIFNNETEYLNFLKNDYEKIKNNKKLDGFFKYQLKNFISKTLNYNNLYDYIELLQYLKNLNFVTNKDLSKNLFENLVLGVVRGNIEKIHAKILLENINLNLVDVKEYNMKRLLNYILADDDLTNVFVKNLQNLDTKNKNTINILSALSENQLFKNLNYDYLEKINEYFIKINKEIYFKENKDYDKFFDYVDKKNYILNHFFYYYDKLNEKNIEKLFSFFKFTNSNESLYSFYHSSIDYIPNKEKCINYLITYNKQIYNKNTYVIKDNNDYRFDFEEDIEKIKIQYKQITTNNLQNLFFNYEIKNNNLDIEKLFENCLIKKYFYEEEKSFLKTLMDFDLYNKFIIINLVNNNFLDKIDGNNLNDIYIYALNFLSRIDNQEDIDNSLTLLNKIKGKLDLDSLLKNLQKINSLTKHDNFKITSFIEKIKLEHSLNDKNQIVKNIKFKI